MDSGEWLTSAATIVGALIALAGVLLVDSLRRQRELQVTEKRLKFYEALWEKLEPAAFGEGNQKPLDEACKRELAKQLTGWFYEKGGGMYLSDSSRNLFLEARKSLYRPDPRSREKLSLLRTRMKADIGQFGRWYRTAPLETWEQEFLKNCGESVWRAPWRRRWALPPKVGLTLVITGAAAWLVAMRPWASITFSVDDLSWVGILTARVGVLVITGWAAAETLSDLRVKFAPRD